MQKGIRHLSLFTLVFALTACGTVQTLAPEQGKVKISYNDKSSYCQSIPRIYSGVAHNFCLMYGEPSKTSYTAAADLPVWAIDTMLCAVTDTLALPTLSLVRSKTAHLKWYAKPLFFLLQIKQRPNQTDQQQGIEHMFCDSHCQQQAQS